MAWGTIFRLFARDAWIGSRALGTARLGRGLAKRSDDRPRGLLRPSEAWRGGRRLGGGGVGVQSDMYYTATR